VVTTGDKFRAGVGGLSVKSNCQISETVFDRKKGENAEALGLGATNLRERGRGVGFRKAIPLRPRAAPIRASDGF